MVSDIDELYAFFRDENSKRIEAECKSVYQEKSAFYDHRMKEGVQLPGNLFTLISISLSLRVDWLSNLSSSSFPPVLIFFFFFFSIHSVASKVLEQKHKEIAYEAKYAFTQRLDKFKKSTHYIYYSGSLDKSLEGSYAQIALK